MLSKLNDDQRRAATTFGKPILVLAPAGTGKTEVLAAKFLHAVEDHGVDPRAILAVTFTRKAAAELKKRIIDAVQRPDITPNDLWIGTFHSLSSKILRAHPHLAAIPCDHFSVIQPEEADRVVATVMRRFDRTAVIDSYKISAFTRTCDRYANDGVDIATETSTWPGSIRVPMKSDLDLMRLYKAELNAMGCLDFGGLITGVLRLFKENPAVLNAWRKRFRLILVDEFQDLNQSQNEWVRLLANDGANLTCVGDDDQSIHMFRGARAEAILEFENIYPSAEVLSLSENYRCPPDMIVRTGRMIANNPSRRAKLTVSATNSVGKLHAVSHSGFDGMISAMTNIIERRDIDLSYNAVAILARTNEQCARIASMLGQRGIPAHILAPEATRSPQFQTLVAWLRLVINPIDDAAFMTAAQNLATPDVVDNLYVQARTKRCSISDLVVHLAERKQFSNANIIKMAYDLVSIRSLTNIASPSETIDAIVTASGIDKQTAALPTQQQTRFWRFYSSLIALSNSNQSLSEILESAQNEIVDTDDLPDAVIISTMHAMKGLQAPLVLSSGWDKNEFPRKKRIGNPKDLEEERRVAYVTITRASRDAWLLYDIAKGPSPFLHELGLFDDSNVNVA